jgi:hypothetical protein
MTKRKFQTLFWAFGDDCFEGIADVAFNRSSMTAEHLQVASETSGSPIRHGRVGSRQEQKTAAKARRNPNDCTGPPFLSFLN